MSLVLRNTPAKVTLEALSTSNKAIVWDEADERTTLVIVTTGAVDVTVIKGNSIQGVSDLTFKLGEAGTYLVKLESGKFKNVSGDNKGHIVLRASADSVATVGIVTMY